MDHPDVKLFIYMDSDAVIDKQFEFTPLNDMMKIMQMNLEWDPILKPIVFNQVCIGSKFLFIKLFWNRLFFFPYRQPRFLLILDHCQ